MTGDRLGTPSYMAPEQAAGKVREIGPTTDVYGLGAVLYAMLTGRPPFSSSSPHETMRLVLSEEPIPPRQLNPAVPRELETVCLKCLEKPHDKRYATARELSEELGRFREGRPVLAQPVSALERGRRWCLRNPLVAGLLLLVFLCMTTGTIVSVLFALSAEKERHEADKQRLRAEAKEKEASDNANDAKREAEERKKETKAVGRRAYGSGMLLLQSAWEQTQMGRFMDLLKEHSPRNDDGEDFRGFEWYYWKRQSRLGHVTVKGHTDSVLSVAFSPDGKRIVSGGIDRFLKIWDASTGSEPIGRE